MPSDSEIKRPVSLPAVEVQERLKYEDLWRSGNYAPSHTSLYMPRFIGDLMANEENGLVSALDIGCGNGVVVDILRQRLHRVWGLDLTLEGVREGKEPPPGWFMQGAVWDLQKVMLGRRFDLTFSSDVLEHVPTDLVDLSIQQILQSTSEDGLTVHVIATFPHEVDGVQLHQTVRPIEWWRKKFEQHQCRRVSAMIIDRREFLSRYE